MTSETSSPLPPNGRRQTGDEFEGRVALVTGAAGEGIGQAIARRLAAGGATVIVTDIHEARTRKVTEAIARDYDARVLGYSMDVANRERVDEVVTTVRDEVGPIRILVNNAAINIMGDIFDYDPEDFERVLAIDLTAPWYLAMVTGRHMKEAGGGSIINIGSIAGDRGSAAFEPPYGISKGGSQALTRGLAKAGGPFNIRCNEIAVGLVAETHWTRLHPEMLGEMLPDVPLGRHATPADVAEAAAFLASDRSSFVTGDILNLSGGFFFRG